MASTDRPFSVTIYYGRFARASITRKFGNLSAAMAFVRDTKDGGYMTQSVHGGLTTLIPWHSIETFNVFPS